MKTLSMLLDAARKTTGLDNFGDDSFREGADRLVAALKGEANLNMPGVQLLEQRLLMHLEQRLRIEEWYRCYPEIDDEEVTAPLIGIGLPRTGSTALSFLLACDPSARSLRAHESSRPGDSVASDTPVSDRVALASEKLPGTRQFVPAGDNPPAECQELMALNFGSQLFLAFAQIPSYAQWLIHADLESTYAYEKRVLKLLQWRNPRAHWRLKAPTHLLYLDAINKVFPDARFVMTHRDPAHVMRSVCALYTDYIGKLTDSLDPHYVGALNVEQWSVGMDRALEFRASQSADRFYDIDFSAMQSDPLGTVRGLYAWLDEPVSVEFERNMHNWWIKNAEQKGAAEYPSADYFGLDMPAIEARFGAYRTQMHDWMATS